LTGSSLEANITSAGAYPWSCMDNLPTPQIYGGGSSTPVRWVLRGFKQRNWLRRKRLLHTVGC